MAQRLGKVLLGLGILGTISLLVWGWREGIFAFGDQGASVGIDRIFFFFFYLPIAMLIGASGFVLSFPKALTAARYRMFLLITSSLMALVAVGFVLTNVSANVRYYDGEDVLGVFSLNLLIAAPLFLLSGVLFFISRHRRHRSSR